MTAAAEEQVLLDIQPPLRAIIVPVASRLVGLGVLMLVCAVAWLKTPWTVVGLWGVALSGAGMLAVLTIAAARRSMLHYKLTTRRASNSAGVLAKFAAEAPLDKIQTVIVHRSLLERLLGLGSVGLLNAADGGQIVWRWVARPEEIASQAREAVNRARGSDPDLGSAAVVERGPGRLPVIGLAGGIGAGKSTVARAFAELGCLVIDSDARAKAALDRPEVRARLVEWWGNEMLNAEGRVDRAKVAAVVFADPEQRRRLEALVHPIVRQERARMIEEARASGAKAAIVDAPLLFEAGVDAECDAVVFVDTPRQQRLSRVRSGRGWDEAELTRREANQLTVEEKRARSRFVIDNADGAEDTLGQARKVLTAILGG